MNALQSAIESQDWESATRHCARAMALPPDVISGDFAQGIVVRCILLRVTFQVVTWSFKPTAENHIPQAQALEVAREELLTIFKRNFEQASVARDSAATSRFFKLFPAIGWESEGLEAYAEFVVDLVRVRAPTSAKSTIPPFVL